MPLFFSAPGIYLSSVKYKKEIPHNFFLYRTPVVATLIFALSKLDLQYIKGFSCLCIEYYQNMTGRFWKTKPRRWLKSRKR